MQVVIATHAKSQRNTPLHRSGRDAAERIPGEVNAIYFTTWLLNKRNIKISVGNAETMAFLRTIYLPIIDNSVHSKNICLDIFALLLDIHPGLGICCRICWTSFFSALNSNHTHRRVLWYSLVTRLPRIRGGCCTVAAHRNMFQFLYHVM
jgi:hypothetical protein